MKTFAAATAAALCALTLPSLAWAQDPAEPPEPTPMTFPAMGIDPADLDTTVRPGDDFYAYVNGKWDRATEIPPQYSTYGATTNLYLGAQRDIRAIVEEMAAKNAPKGSLEQRVGDTYKAFLDANGIEKRGMAPIQPYLTKIQQVRTQDDLARLFAEPGIPSPLGVGVTIDEKDPTKNTLMFNIGGLGLPDRDNYLVDTPKNLEMRAKYKDFLAFMLGKAGYKDTVGAANAVYELERKIAAADWDRAVARDPELTYNKVTSADLEKMAGSFPLKTFLVAQGIREDDPMVVTELLPDAAKAKALGMAPADLAKLGGGMPELFRIIRETPINTWQAWATTHTLVGASRYLPKDIDDANFAFYGQYLSGQKTRAARWRRAISTVEGAMGEAVGELYVQRHFPASSKAAMVDLVGNLRKAMASSQETLPWMTPATRKAAREKLDAFTVKIGYPDKFETYDGLVVTPDDPLANAFAASKWQWDKDLSDLRKPVDRSKWYMTPQTVNAYYNPPSNEIVFPAAYLQPPNYGPQADPAVNYGGIGTTIGHEISHGFDDQGAKYDGTGKLRNWWQPSDTAAFRKATDKLVKQYNEFCPFDSGKTCINGSLTLGENIADLSGLAISYKAYRMSLGGKEAPVIQGLTGDQRFFISYALSHREKWREAFERQILQTDPHAPEDARTNMVVRNFDPWYKAFNVKPGDKLYLPPAERVKIW